MIKFYCAFCKKKIGVPDSYIGKQVQCPKCRLATVVPPVSASAPPDSPPPPPEEITADPFPSVYKKDPVSLAESVSPDDPVSLQSPAEQRPASDEKTDRAPAKARWFKSVEMGRSFGKDLLGLMSPIKTSSDIFTFSILLFLYSLTYVDQLIMLPCCVWFFARILLRGFIFTYLFNVLLETANGINHLPEFELPEDYWEMVRPYLQVIVSGLYTFLPFLVCLSLAITVMGFSFIDELIAADSFSNDPNIVQNEDFFDSFPNFDNQDIAPREPNTVIVEDFEEFYSDAYGEDEPPAQGAILLWVAIALFLVGLFFWPMIILNIVLGDTFIVNPVLIIMNIIRTFKAYFVCCLTMLAAAGLTYLSTFFITLEDLMLNFSIYMLLAAIGSVIGGLCVQIFTMRALGLLYRYHEEKLDW